MHKTKIVVLRLIRLALTIWIISTLVFFLVRILPGDPAAVIAGIDAGSEEIEAVRSRLGLEGSIFVQYGRYLGNIVRLDFGRSLISGEPVAELIRSRFPLTLSLAVSGMIIAYLIAIPLGILSAVRRWSFWDAAGMTFSQIGMAVPSFWLGIILLLLFSVQLGWFPLFGTGSLRHLVLPAFSLGIGRAAILLRMTRASMVEELGKDYIITARAKGLPLKRIYFRHALQNAFLPVLTVSGIQFGSLLGGAIIIEQIFSLPGLGRLFLTSIYQRDFTLLQGSVIFMAVIYSLVNFLVDTLYTIVNPKIGIQ